MTDNAVIGEAVAAQVAGLAPEAKAAARTQMAKFFPEMEIARVFDAPPAAPAAKVETPPAPASDTPATLPIPQTPDGYRFTYSRDRLAMDATALAKFAGELRTALHAAQVPVVLAQPILDGLDASAALYREGMTEDQRKALFQEEGWKLHRAYGEAGAKEIGELASAAYQRLPQAFREQVDRNYGFHSAQAQAALAAIEREHRQRTGAAK
jgi:hypothetical protein